MKPEAWYQVRQKETLTFHLFLRSPSDNLCIKTTIGEYLLFDGENLSWIDKRLKMKKQWPGVSGDGKQKDEKKDADTLFRKENGL